MRATPERTQKPQLIEAMRHSGWKEDGDVDKTVDRMVSIPKESTQGWQGVSGLRVGTSKPTNFDRDDMENTRKLEKCAEHVKPSLALAKDFKKQLAEIDAGIHGEASGLMKEKGVVTKVMESIMCQDFILMHIPLNGLSCAVSNGLIQQAFMGLTDAHRPNMPLVRDFTTE